LDPDHSNSLQWLQRLGFNESESRVYVTLLQHEPLTGYELAKASGVPRANVYTVLQKLEQRGVVVRLDRAEGTRYAPVPADELLQRLRQRYEHALAQTGQALATLAPAVEAPPIVQLEGRENFIETAQQLIRNTEQRLMMALWPDEARALAAELANAEQRAIEIITLCLAGCREECGGCRGSICRYPFGLEESERWLLLVVDETELCAGAVQASELTVAIRTRQPFLARLATWYIRHSIAVATLITDLNLHLDEALSPQAREALDQLLPSRTNQGWLEQMRQLLRERKNP
jgi:predicted transcriptional regulator